MSATANSVVERYCTKKGCPGAEGCANKHRKSGEPCTMEYVAAALPENLRWRGEGPPPSSWYASGTKVYRSYSDYCD
jgi:hypothetical protein